MAITTLRPARGNRGGEREPDEGAGDPGSRSERFDDFDHSLNQAIEGALDVGGWTAGDRMGELEERLEREVEAAMKNESEMAPRVLDIVEKNIKDAPNTSSESGLFSVTPDEITGACRDVLFNGLTEACDGTRVTHDTLPISVIQIGLCMTSYLDDGRPTSIGHRLFRHDMVRKNGDAAAEVLAFIQSRSRKLKPDDNRGVSDMLVRAIMAYGERYLLTEKSKAPWRLGHGTPMPYELLTGSGHGKVIELALELLPKLLAEHRKFAFVPSDTSDAEIKTIANALRPLQYAVLTNTSYMVDRCINYMEDGREAQSYRGNYRSCPYRKFHPVGFGGRIV